MLREYPLAPLVGVGCLVVDDQGRVLLVKRGQEPGKGLWSIPGGLLRVGERLEQAAMREVQEETGIRIQIEELLGVFECIERDEQGRVRFHYVLIDYLARPVGGVLRPGSDALDARFFVAEEALRLSLTRSTRKLLERFLASRQ